MIGGVFSEAVTLQQHALCLGFLTQSDVFLSILPNVDFQLAFLLDDIFL